MDERIILRGKRKKIPLFLRIFLIFLALVGASTLLVGFFDMEFGSSSYWNHHGTFFLIFVTFFPRLTLFVSSVAFGGFFWWMSWLFLPRILVATLSTVAYFQTNPILVVISWLVALSGESSEKYIIQTRTNQFRGRKIKTVKSQVID